MFLDYFGLNEQPFGVTPDPRFLYLGPKHGQALAALDYGTESDRGFLTLIAKPGMGKTSVLFHYLESLRTKARTAFVFQTDGDSRDLMRYLLADLGVDSAGKELPEMRALLNTLLLEEVRTGRQFVLVIDEAQNLDEKTLESIRLLSNFETPQTKLIQIVLAGQPQLAERLASPSMSQLRQRISFIIRIEPFTHEEVAAYVDHRLWVAGYKGAPLFTDGARLLIAEHSEGIPRNINNICFNAMTLGWALKQKTIDRDMVRDIVADLDLNRKVSAPAHAPSAPPTVPMSPRIHVAQPVITTPTPIANPHPAAPEPSPSPLAESASAAPRPTQVNEVQSVRVVCPATATSRASTDVTPRARTPRLLETLPLGVAGGSRKGVLIAAAFILFVFVAGAAIGGYRLYGQGRRLSATSTPQRAVNLPQNEAASPVLSQVDPPIHDVMTAALNSTSLPLAEANLSDPSPASVARAPLSRVRRNNLAIGDLKAPVLRTVSSNSVPVEAPPALVRTANDLSSLSMDNTLLAGTGTGAPKPPSSFRPSIGGQLQPPQLISSTPPVYPPDARAQRVQGVVVLDVLVDETGKVVEMTVLAGPPPLQLAAKEALRNWKYQPARLNGEPIQAHVKVNTRFSLN